MSHTLPIRRVGTVIGGALGVVMIVAVFMVASASNAASWHGILSPSSVCTHGSTVATFELQNPAADWNPSNLPMRVTNGAGVFPNGASVPTGDTLDSLPTTIFAPKTITVSVDWPGVSDTWTGTVTAPLAPGCVPVTTTTVRATTTTVRATTTTERSTTTSTVKSTTTTVKQSTTTLTTLPPKCADGHCVITTVTTVPQVTVQGAAVAVEAQPVFTG